MWILVLAAFFATPSGNEARAIAAGTFETARECIAAKRDLEKLGKEQFGADVRSFGIDCVQIKPDVVPDKAKAPKA